MNIAEDIRNGNLDALKIAFGENPELVNKPLDRGFTPLVLATYHNQIAVAELLIEEGADINAKDPMMGMTALMGVCFKGSFELAKLLLEKGADASIKNNNGESALDFAKQGGFKEIVVLMS